MDNVTCRNISEPRYTWDGCGDCEIDEDVFLCVSEFTTYTVGEYKKNQKAYKWITQNFKKLLGCIDSNHEASFKEICQGVVDNNKVDEFFKVLQEQSNAAKEKAICVSRMSIANSSCKTAYNLKGPDMHYRVSTQIHGCILNYTPGIIGYNFLPWEYMLVDQDFVDKEREEFKIEKKSDRERRRKKVRKSMAQSLNTTNKTTDKHEYLYRDVQVKI